MEENQLIYGDEEMDIENENTQHVFLLLVESIAIGFGGTILFIIVLCIIALFTRSHFVKFLIYL